MRKIGLVVLIMFFISLFHGQPVYAENSIDTQILVNTMTGTMLLKDKKYEDAAGYLTKAIDLDPNNIQNLLLRSMCYFHLNKYDAALGDFNAVFKLNPKNGYALYNKACLYSVLNDRDTAIKSLQQVLDMDSRFKGVAIQDKDFDNIRDSEQFRALTGITVRIDGKALVSDTSPVVVDNRTLVPLRAIFEALGVNVEWDGETRTIRCNQDKTTMTLQIDNLQAQVNGKSIILDTPATVINDRTYVPVRFVAESLGANVNWLDNTQEIYITSPDDNISGAPVDEKTVMDGLKKNLDYCPIDGAFYQPYKMDKTEGIAIFVAKTQDDLRTFQSLNDENKKMLLNDIVQSKWGDFIGCQNVRIYMTFAGKRYAEIDSGYQTKTSDLTLFKFKQGIDTNVVIQDKRNDFFYDYYGNTKPIFNIANVKKDGINVDLTPYTIYFNDQLFGSISYPKTWKVVADKQIVTFLSPSEGTGDIFPDNVNIHVNLIPKDKMDKLRDPDAFIEYINMESSIFIPDLNTVSAKLDIKQDWGNGYIFVYTMTKDSAALKGKSYVFQYNDGLTLYYELCAEQKNFDKYDKIFEAMMNTLVLGQAAKTTT